MNNRPAIITLTTDFGAADVYVAAMKGVILSINRQAAIVDITHAVRPQRVEQAVFLLQEAWPFFPEGTIHVVVVDPGVGTARRALAVKTEAGIFVGPDNGVLSAALPQEIRPPQASPVQLPRGYQAVALTNPAYFHQPVSTTFHGRDIFAPVAAHLSLGVPLAEVGEPVHSVFALPPLRAPRRADGSIHGRVLHVDTFGNLITDIHSQDIGDPLRTTVDIAGRRIIGLSHHYQERPGLLALVGSSGYLEIALPNASAAQELGADVGTPVTVLGGS